MTPAYGLGRGGSGLGSWRGGWPLRCPREPQLVGDPRRVTRTHGAPRRDVGRRRGRSKDAAGVAGGRPQLARSPARARCCAAATHDDNDIETNHAHHPRDHHDGCVTCIVIIVGRHSSGLWFGVDRDLVGPDDPPVGCASDNDHHHDDGAFPDRDSTRSHTESGLHRPASRRFEPVRVHRDRKHDGVRGVVGQHVSHHVGLVSERRERRRWDVRNGGVAPERLGELHRHSDRAVL
jgi:hypothetical protein